MAKVIDLSLSSPLYTGCVIMEVGVGVAVGTCVVGVAEGVALCAIWDPDGKILNDLETLRVRPNVSTESMVIEWFPEDRETAGLYDQFPLGSDLTLAEISLFGPMFILTILFGNALP